MYVYFQEFLPVIHSNDPSNSGMKQLLHYGQEVRDGESSYLSKAGQF
jgi:hypothetical protein